MGSAFNKEIVRSIAGSAGRFAAIAIISFLGAGFFAGLRMSAPDMLLAGDEFFDGARLYDISVSSELGLDDESLGLLAGVEGVGEVMATHRRDAMVEVAGTSYAACVESFPVGSARASASPDGVNVVSEDDAYLNRLLLVEGEWPAEGAADECVLGVDAARNLGVDPGDVLTIEEAAGADDVSDVLACASLRVVGLVNSAAYASASMLGTTTLGTGELELYLYVGSNAFADEVPYSVAYLSVPAARGPTWGTDAYDAAVREVAERVEARAGELARARRAAVKDALHFELMGLVQEAAADLDWADDIAEPEVYVLDRSKNPGAASLASDAEGITNIATFLPFMFFLVAALVSLTSMTRMVDEERVEIGTHKALGYGGARITSKYLLYGVLASGVGSSAGVFVLGKLLPWFIMTSYQVSYAVPVVPLPIHVDIAAWAIGLSVGVTAVATWGAAASTLRSRPALLMVPRAPKAGKRIVLERLGPLWRRLSFSQKVTARNLLRYKRRFLMAVVGVAGCTALLMIGFGLRDMISGIVENQYGGLLTYDMTVRCDEGATKNEREGLAGTLEASADVEDCLLVSDFNMIAEGAEDEMRVEVVVPSAEEALGRFVVLRNREGGEPITLEAGGIVLTEKAARVLGAHVGDAVELYDENDVGERTGEPRSFKVAGVAENYLGHYAYLLPSDYEGTFGEPPVFDMAYVRLASGADAKALANRVLALDGVSTASLTAEKMRTYEDMLEVMNKLIYVVAMLSAALAFVVLYNLTNINIAERIREIATLKVLGFTRREMNVYVFREVMVMALLGAFAGCIVGVPAALSIAEAAETAQMMFGRVVEPASFVLSFAFTMVFAIVAAFTMRGRLARVDMVESLKSVE